LDDARPGAPQLLVKFHHVIKLFEAARSQQFRQGYRVLNRNVSPLPMMRQHAVRGVAHQHNAAALPGSQGPDREQAPAETVRDRAYHFDNGGMPALEGRNGLLVCHRRNPMLMRPGRWSFDNGEKIDVQSRWADWIVQKMRIRLSLLKNLADLGVRSSATLKRRDFGPTTGPFKICAPRLRRVEKGRISLTESRSTDCGGLGRATFVATVEAADLRKCSDLASRRRLDAAAVRTIFV
jgi:hypothetical protein